MEKVNNEVAKIINFVDPTTLIDYPTTSTSISDHLISVLTIEASNLDLTDEEKKVIEEAINTLRWGKQTNA